MKTIFKQATLSFALASSLLMSGIPAFADGAAESASAAVYKMNADLPVRVKGVFNEKTTGGVRLGAVIRMNNTSNHTLRIPDHELRVKTPDGFVYTLRPSSANERGIQPGAEVELTYMLVVNRTSQISLTELSLIDVNYDVYPKQETALFTIPIDAIVWKGKLDGFKDAALLKKWGESFTIPTLESPLSYRTISISKTNSNDGSDYVVKLLATNPSDRSETVPALELAGKTKTDVFTGREVEANPVVLEPGENKYIHFAIHTEMNAVLASLNVLTTETFAQAGTNGTLKVSNFGIGKLNIDLAQKKSDVLSYAYESPITFEAWNDAIHQDLKVALTELRVADNEDQGSKLAVAKFKFTNKGLTMLPIPALLTELQSPGGYDYTGIRQSQVQSTIAPGTSSVVNYTFVLPVSETAETFTMKLQQSLSGGYGDDNVGGTSGGTKSAYKSTIASFQVTPQGKEDRHKITLYPYTLNIKDYFLNQITSPDQMIAITYTYKLQLFLELDRDPRVLTDQTFSRLKFELVDPAGSILGSKSFPFTGTDRLVSGKQTLTFNHLTTDQIQSNVSVKVYESILTPSGEVNRLITELK
ncbi:hypothetical protein GCM10008018_42250 [Paenibacillus marchantiophytorum]|uniref:Uncharacterized protein n=1 Tax=Paenibacillus marchantiophytorum TaxID=1619310 RepID=A0ABQ1EYP3_9BACL|nr:hypothetical protein [Paenibacillus marchantiophytorum]GFZ91464.1 hypothetical protein GCM10008018_42250 [Paenibacillus marchantiophytorum]